jgi:hypothetical protein
MSSANYCRRIRFQPWRKGMGPTFTLTTWDDVGYDERGAVRLRYRLTMREHGKSIVLFEGQDFCSSPGEASDSDASHACLMSFLTLRPGDTDPEYFENYTDAQRDYCAKHAEFLNCEASNRLGEY